MTPNFSLAEFVRSSTAARLRLSNDLPPALTPAALQTLAMMQRIRDRLCLLAGRDIPVTITSGYRSPAVNTAVGSSGTSDHIRAAACDWRAPAFGTPTEICTALAPLVGDLQIGQLINEFPGPNGWVHTSTRVPQRAANRIITITASGIRSGVHAS